MVLVGSEFKRFQHMVLRLSIVLIAFLLVSSDAHAAKLKAKKSRTVSMHVDAKALPYAVDLKVQLTKSPQRVRSEIIKIYRATGDGRYVHYYDVHNPTAQLTLFDYVSDENVYSYRLRYSARIRKSKAKLDASGSAAVFYSPPETPPSATPGAGNKEPPPAIDLGPGEQRCPAEFINEVVALVNLARQGQGLAALTLNSQLSWASDVHNDWMIRNNLFEHTGWYESILESGFQGTSFGQNIARYIPTAAGVVEGWLNSPFHRANIMKDSFHNIGVGCTYAPGGEIWWTQDFGS